MYAFAHKQTGEYLTGSDFNYYPPRSRKSATLPPLLMATKAEATQQRKRRHLSYKTWQTVEVGIHEVPPKCDHLVEFDSMGQELRVSGYAQHHWQISKFSFNFCPDCGADITHLRGKKF